MKSALQLVATLAITSILSSCGGGGDSISEVKLFPVQSGNDFQYIDRQGKIIINPQFKQATVFRDGLALVQKSGNEPKWGFITEDGKYAINAQYKEATVFSDGLAWVVAENAAPTAIDKKGAVKFTLKDAEQVRVFKDGLAAFNVITEEGESKWGFVDKTGKVVIAPQFLSVSNFSDGKCGVSNSDGKWGFIDKEGKISINHQFDGADDFKNGKCIVKSSDKEGVIGKDGKYIVNPQFSNMYVDGDLFMVQEDEKWGWCDKEGKLVINPQFEQTFPFNDNSITAVKSGKNWGYIDKDGKISINPQFDAAFPFIGKLALVKSNKKVGFIDKEGKYVINPQFDEASIDLLMYTVYGSSAYEGVETDFFNITAIVNRVNINTPEGLSFSSKLSDVVTKLEITENEFKKYSDEHRLISNEKITNDASVSFYVIATAFKDIPDGWYTRKVFNSESVVEGYGYAIDLSGKGYGKEKDVKDAIEKSFSGYKKDEAQSTENMSVFKNAKQTIKSFIENSEIIIVITSNLYEDDTAAAVEEVFEEEYY
jgi:hypothetical protein